MRNSRLTAGLGSLLSLAVAGCGSNVDLDNTIDVDELITTREECEDNNGILAM